MSSMFPTMVSDPNDPNRRYRGTVGDTWPFNLKLAFVLICAAAVLMLVTSMFLISQGFPAERIDESYRSSYMTNMRTASIGNIVLALVLVSAASYFRQGSRLARRVAAGAVALACFLNVVAFILKVTSWASMVIVALLAFAMLFAFRQDANAFMDKKSPRFA